MRRVPVLLAVACVLLALGLPARAAWTWVGVGTGAGRALALAVPGSPTAAAVTPTDSAVDVSFAVPAQPPGTTYTVVRDVTAAGSPGPAVACAGLTASPCHDTGLASGTTFTYTVTAVLAGWSRSAATTATASTTGPLTITKGGTAGNSSKAKFSGTGAAAGATIQVHVCRASGNPCTPTSSAYLETVSFTPTANGTWGPTGTTSKLANNQQLEAQATDGARVSPLFPFVS